MEKDEDEKNSSFDKNALMLTEEDIDTQECYRHLLPEQKEELIAFIYEVSIVLYKLYSNNDESI